MTGEELKEFIKSRGESYAEFAELVGVSASSLANAISTGKVSTQLAASCRLLAQIDELRGELSDYEALKNLVSKMVGR